MGSLESIHEHLQIASNRLDQAVNEIYDLPLEPKKKYARLIGEVLANIIQIKREIYNQRPELEPDYFEEMPDPDPCLTIEEKALVDALDDEAIEEIDNILISHAHQNWRKVASLVGHTMMDLKNKHKGISDVFYAQRVQKLVEDRRLESQGNLQYMRFSEVRLPSNSQ